MSAEKDRKAVPPASVPPPATRTVVGVPSLLPDGQEGPRPGEAPPKTSVPPAAITPKPPSVAGALPKPSPSGKTLKTPPLGGELFQGLNPESRGRPLPPEQGTRHGVAPQPPMAIKGRATLLLDSSMPPMTEPDEAPLDQPPIVVPTSGMLAPKAVTQPPPWSDDAARASPSIPKTSAAPRRDAGAIEEITASHLLPADSSWDELTEGTGAELTTGSIVLDDPALDEPSRPQLRPAGPASKPPPLPRSVAARALPASHPPPLPRSVPPPGRSAPPKPKSLPPPPPLPGAASGVSKSVPPPRIEYVAPPPPPPAAAAPPPPEPAVEAAPSPEASIPPAPAAPAPPIEGEATAIAPAEPPLARTMSSQADPLAPPPEGAAKPDTPRLAERLAPVRERWARGVTSIRALARSLQAKLPPGSALASASRPTWFLPAIAVGGLIAGIGLVGIAVSIFRGKGHPAEPTAPSSVMSNAPSGSTALPVAAPSLPPSVEPAASIAPAPSPSPEPPPPAPCRVAGAPRILAPAAVLAAGVEAVRLGEDVALGFAVDEHEGVALRVDAASLATKATAKARSGDTVRRVTPLVKRGGALGVALDADKKADRVQGRRTVPLSPPVQMGAADGALVWAQMNAAPAGKLWSLEGEGAVEALRSSIDDRDKTLAIVFRRGGAVWLGTASGDGAPQPKGDLAHVAGLGPVVGSPAVAVAEGHGLAVWADRASGDEPWRLRWTHFTAGEAPSAAATFEPPPGGKGQNAMSPSIAPLSGGRFLLVWTEGPISEHEVRALTVTGDGRPIGAPLAVSSPGVNAGQAQAAVTGAGQGAVGFLSAAGERFEVAATPVVCSP